MPNESHPHNWPEAAGCLYGELGARSLQTNVRELLAGDSCQRVLVACSGGADSIFMLCQLWAQADELDVELVVAHYNHRWRGEESQLDATFVQELAQQLNCPFVTAARPENEAAFTETTARALRLDFLRAAAQEHSCQCIAFGHQQDDVLETQLQRLARGCGSRWFGGTATNTFFPSLSDTCPTGIAFRCGGDSDGFKYLRDPLARRYFQ